MGFAGKISQSEKHKLSSEKKRDFDFGLMFSDSDKTKRSQYPKN